jgi:pantoate--beta-alanine ligase
MQVIHTVAELRDALRGSANVSFVPTMGNLHAGHLSLIERAAAVGRPVVASIFVNRLQFAPNEDFDQYPRTLARDCELLQSAGCDFVFAPHERRALSAAAGVPATAASGGGGYSRRAFSSRFFTGVCTVVLKLFNIVRPQVAVFGKKDYQQLLVIRGMVQQCALPIEVVGADTVRESTGLAMSSRNGYLSGDQRAEATHLYEELLKARGRRARRGSRDYLSLESAAAKALSHSRLGSRLHRRASPGRLGRTHRGQSAGRRGRGPLRATRLIDNIEI